MVDSSRHNRSWIEYFGGLNKLETAMKTEKHNSIRDDSQDLATNDLEQPEHQELVTSELSPVQIDELKSKAAKADDCWDRLLRQTADFENYKKRVQRERQEAIRY